MASPLTAPAALGQAMQQGSYHFATKHEQLHVCWLKVVCWLKDCVVAISGAPQGALTQLKELAAYPHLANGDYGDVNREIKKIITKDSNIQVRASRHS
jgi:hypothetical protein